MSPPRFTPACWPAPGAPTSVPFPATQILLPEHRELWYASGRRPLVVAEVVRRAARGGRSPTGYGQDQDQDQDAVHGTDREPARDLTASAPVPGVGDAGAGCDDRRQGLAGVVRPAPRSCPRVPVRRLPRPRPDTGSGGPHLATWPRAGTRAQDRGLTSLAHLAKAHPVTPDHHRGQRGRFTDVHQTGSTPNRVSPIACCGGLSTGWCAVVAWVTVGSVGCGVMGRPGSVCPVCP